jgi:hypothetical protein
MAINNSSRIYQVMINSRSSGTLQQVIALRLVAVHPLVALGHVAFGTEHAP